MKLHFELYHAFDLIRHHTDMVTMSDALESLKENKDINGGSLGLSIGDAKTEIDRVSKAVILKSDNIQIFIDRHDSYDLSIYTDKTHFEALTDKAVAKTFANEMIVVSKDTDIKTLDDLSKVETKPSAILNYANSVNFTVNSPEHYLLMMNDFMDASGYVLRGINHKTGQSEVLLDGEKKDLVRRMLNQFRNLLGIFYSPNLRIEVDALIVVKNKVLNDLDTESLIDIADYIVNNTDRLPLMRRLWSL